MPSIFTRIINREIPTKKIEFEDEFCFVIHDLHPKAPIHLLIIPRKEISTIMAAEDSDQALLGHLLIVARNMGKRMGLEGYKLQFNVGEKGGQEVPHIHLHLLGG